MTIGIELNSDGTVQINIADLISAMDDDAKAEVIKMFAWERAVSDEVKEIVLNEYAAKNFNDDIWQIRLAFLTSDGADERVRDVVGKLLRDIDGLKKSEDRWRKSYWDLFHAFPKDVQRPVMKEFELGAYPSVEEVDEVLI